MDDLESKLKEAREGGARHVMIATDGVFSMDGYLARLLEIRALADQYDALIMVDDCHATGFMGPRGAGTPAHAGVEVDILTGTLGKALGGAIGGYVAASQPVVDMLRQRGRPYLFSNALPPAVVGAGIRALDLVTEGDDLRAQLFENADYWRAGLTNSNAEASALAMPLAMAMTVNVGFIVGLVFVPRLWSIVEYLFPAAMVAFALIGLLAFRMIGSYLSRVLGDGRGFNPDANNSFVQLVPAFALTMIAVGFAAPAAMSTAKLTVSASLILSTFLAVVSVVYVLAAAVPAITSMLRNGVAREAAPTLMIIVPIVTVLSILTLRQSHGLHTTFDAHANAGETLVFLAQMLSIQVAFLLLGGAVLKAQGYFKDFVIGSKTSPGSYALVCPAVAFSVLLHFFVNKGLVGAGVIEKFGAGYWAMTAIAIAAQIIAIAMVLRLNRQHFRRVEATAIPAE